jgi:serine/threonine-protein kinase
LRGSEQATNELPQVIPDRIGRFEIRDWLGSGTFGEIFLGLDSDLKRKVAIRVPRSDYLAVTRSGQFLREARTAAQLDHPGIVGVLEVRDGEDGTYIVSDFIDGLPLDRCTNGRAMAANEAFQILLTVSLAIEHVHQAG